MNSLDLTLALGVAIGGGLLISLVLTPLVRLLFLKIGIADRPDANRKLQRDAVSLGGGLAVFLATCAASVAAIVFAMSQGWTWSDDRGTAGHAQELLIAAVATLALGLVDDSITLRGRQKLLGQIAISAYIVTTGTVVRQIELFGYQIDLGVMAGPLTAVWILAAINAVNLIDGADGIASTAGSIILASLAIMAIMSGWLFEGSSHRPWQRPWLASSATTGHQRGFI